MFRRMSPTLCVALSARMARTSVDAILRRPLEQLAQAMGTRHGPPVHPPHLAHADGVVQGGYRHPPELRFQHTGRGPGSVRNPARLHVTFIGNQRDELPVVPRRRTHAPSPARRARRRLRQSASPSGAQQSERQWFQSRHITAIFARAGTRGGLHASLNTSSTPERTRPLQGARSGRGQTAEPLCYRKRILCIRGA